MQHNLSQLSLIMKRFFSYPLFIFCFVSFIEMSQTSCANMIPPSGGVKDTIPPKLISAVPRDSSKNTTTNKIVLTFDEFVEVKEISENIIVSPLPKNNPLIEYKLKNVTIKLKDSLEANTTYSINFGKSIRDVNEGNEAKNFTYTFSTGNIIDSNSLSGKIILAEDGKIDSTLIAILHRNTSDTAVYKTKPRYIAKLKADGSFTFKNLPEGKFALYALPNDYSKKYDDSTKLFAFADSIISINKNSSPVTLYAFQEAKKKPTVSASTTSNDRDKKLRYQVDLASGKQDILNDTFSLEFNKKLKTFDTLKMILYDTLYKKIANYSIIRDTLKNKINIIFKWQPNFQYTLLIQKDAVTDTNNSMLPKNDTIKFSTKKLEDYGSIKINFNKIDTSKNLVLQIIKDNKLIEAIKISEKILTRKLFNPGEYELRILLDKNKNGIWDAGNYKQKRQPEIVNAIKQKLGVRANWDNEIDINL